MSIDKASSNDADLNPAFSNAEDIIQDIEQALKAAEKNSQERRVNTTPS